MLRLKNSILLLLMAIFSLQVAFAQNKNYPIKTVNGIQYYVYKVEPSEGLFAIGRKFNMKPDEIVKNNPTLKDLGLRSDQEILIPVNAGTASDKFIEHTIEPKETLFSVSRKYGLSPEILIAYNQGLSAESFQIGRKVKVPKESMTEQPEISNESIRQAAETVSRALNQAKRQGEISVAVILPILQANETNLSSFRFLEFYEGMLLAVEDLKRENISVNLYVFDTGDPAQELFQVFNNEGMKNVDMIIGPVNSDQIKLVGDFAIRNEIPVVLPFTSGSSEALRNPYIFQINTPSDFMLAKTAENFCSVFKNSEIIFLNIEGEKRNKGDLANAMQTALKEHGIVYKEITKSIDNLLSLGTELSTTNENVIIPTSSNGTVLCNVPKLLRVVSLNDTINTLPITLFGFPEWLSEKEYTEDFYALNTYIYTPFYDDVFSNNSQSFSRRFFNWYSKDVQLEALKNSPKYSMLGFDTGNFFLRALKRYGKSGINQIANFQWKSIQTDFNFEHANPEGGYVNTNVYFINYKPDYSINKIYFKHD